MSTPAHPAPERHAQPMQWLALIGAPAAWILQMTASQLSVTNGCGSLRTQPLDWLHSHLFILLIIIHGACFLTALLCTLINWRAWRRTRHERSGQGMKAHHQTIEVGEGRTHFFVMLGLLSNSLFLVAIIFTACTLLTVSSCS